MNSLTTGVIDPVRVGVHAAVRLGMLPAFPSQDWCTQAATIMSALGKGGDAAVAIARWPSADRSPIIEAIGATESRLEALGEPEDTCGPLGWRPKSLSGTSVFQVSATPFHAAWAASARGKVWRQIGASDLLIGLEPVRSSAEDRVVITELALPPDSQESVPPVTRVLQCVLPLLADRVTKAFNGGAITPATWLTGREQEVLEHIVLGHTVREIAERIGRSPHTVHDHVKSLHKKLHANTRGELVARALGHPQLHEHPQGSNGDMRSREAARPAFR